MTVSENSIPLVSSKASLAITIRKNWYSFQLKEQQRTNRVVLFWRVFIIPSIPPLFLYTPYRSIRFSRLLTNSDKQALSSILWKKGSMMQNDSTTSQQSLLSTDPLCGCVFVNSVQMGAGGALGQIMFILGPRGESWCISWYFFQLWSCSGGWRFRNNEGTCNSEFLHHLPQWYRAAAAQMGTAWPNLRLFL